MQCLSSQQEIAMANYFLTATAFQYNENPFNLSLVRSISIENQVTTLDSHWICTVKWFYVVANIGDRQRAWEIYKRHRVSYSYLDNNSENWQVVLGLNFCNISLILLPTAKTVWIERLWTLSIFCFTNTTTMFGIAICKNKDCAKKLNMNSDLNPSSC